MKNRKLARRYAEALGSLALEQELLDKVEEELMAVRRTLLEEASFRRALENQMIDSEEKAQMIREAFAGRLSRITLNFLLLVVTKHRETYLDQMIEEFVAYANEKRGIVEVEVTTAASLTEAQAEAVAEKLSQVLGKRVRLSTREDQDLLGGVVARIGDLVMDGSVRTRLRALKESLQKAQLN